MTIIKSHGAPTELTVGEVGQRYIDLDTDTKYVCVDIEREEFHEDGPSIHNSFVTTNEFKGVSNFYIWEELAGGSNFDAIIRGVPGDSDDEWTLEKGDHETIADKILAGIPVRALIHYVGDGASVDVIECASYIHADNMVGVAFMKPDGMFVILSDNTLHVEFMG